MPTLALISRSVQFLCCLTSRMRFPRVLFSLVIVALPRKSLAADSLLFTDAHARGSKGVVCLLIRLNSPDRQIHSTDRLAKMTVGGSKMNISIQRAVRAACTASLVISTASFTDAVLAAAPESRVLEEIVVTAQKKEEKLSETPLSITAISSAQIEALGATQFRDIADTVPGLSIIGNGVGQSQVNLRGVTTGADVAPTVGIYVDDVPYGSSTPFGNFAQLALDVGLFDLNRVEVLRGPQGTLYGASTMGGLIKYVTTMPDTNAYSGSARAGISSTRAGGVSYDGAGAVNAPLIPDVAAVRVSGFYSHDGGFVDNLTRGTEDIDQAKLTVDVLTSS